MVNGDFHGDYGTARRTPAAVVVELSFEFKGSSDPNHLFLKSMSELGVSDKERL